MERRECWGHVCARKLGICSSMAALLCAHEDRCPGLGLRSWFLPQHRFRGHRLCEFARKNRSACEGIMPHILSGSEPIGTPHSEKGAQHALHGDDTRDGSNGRFYATSSEVLGMTPTNFGAGRLGTSIWFAIGECSLGSILVAKSDRGVCAILLGDDPDALARDLQDRFPRANLIGGDGEFEQLVAQVVGFVEAPGIGLDLPLDVRRTAFQQWVWQALREIPSGETASYTDIANRIGSPNSVRAVAQACAANALAVAIPCHRIVRNDGGLSGYRWDVERKRAPLEKEAHA